jgi:DmsE family decaheme c-type cytochrome
MTGWWRRPTDVSLILSLWIAVFIVQLRAADTGHIESPEQGRSSQYVGADTCKMCHEDVFKDVQKTPHWNSVLKLKGGDKAHSCETCHGPGADHVSAGGDKTKIFVFKGASAQAIAERCLACHNRREEIGHFEQSAHAGAGVSCTSCHSPHFAKEPHRLLAAKQPALCYQCHTEKVADFNKPFHHRVNEGLVRCSDCHNPHGAPLTRSLRADAAADAVCFKCHRSLQGPFVFEHVPVKTEGCQACHDPHGSINPRLLKVNQVNILCLQCHTPGVTPNTRAGEVNAPGTPNGPVHDQSAKFQACTMCHVQIHGSNADETFMK